VQHDLNVSASGARGLVAVLVMDQGGCFIQTDVKALGDGKKFEKYSRCLSEVVEINVFRILAEVESILVHLRSSLRTSVRCY